MRDADEVAAELARIEALARRRWRLFTIALVVLVLLVMIGATAAGALGSYGTHHRHHATASVIGGVVAAVVIIVAGVILRVVARHRAWRIAQAPLALGLPWARRFEVSRHVRRGTPSADPVLREVERITLDHALAVGRIAQVVFPALVVVAILFIAIPGPRHPDRPLWWAYLVLFGVLGAAQIVQRRRMIRFRPRWNAHD